MLRKKEKSFKKIPTKIAKSRIAVISVFASLLKVNFFSAAANSYELITVRGYPVHVYCAWPDAENTEARTFLKLRTDAPSSFSVWGGVKPGIKADIDSWSDQIR